MTGKIKLSLGAFVLANALSFQAEADAAYVSWVQESASTISQLESLVAAATVPTMITLADGTYTDKDCTLTGNTAEVVITASSYANVHFRRVITVNSDDITVQHFSFDGGVGSDGNIKVYGDNMKIKYCLWDNSYAEQWVAYESGAINGEIAYCTFRNKTNNTVSTPSGARQVIQFDKNRADDPMYHHMHHCYVHDIPYDSINTNGEPVQLYQSEQTPPRSNANCTIEYNLFYKANGDPECISSKTGGNIIRYNTLIECAGRIVLRAGNGSEVYGNYFDGNGSTSSSNGGIRSSGSNHLIYNNYMKDLYAEAIEVFDGNENYDDSNNLTIIFNTAHDCDDGFRSGRTLGEGNDNIPDGCDIRNNIFVKGTGTYAVNHASAFTNATFTDNIAHGTSTGLPANNSTADPLLVAGSYEPKVPDTGSPAIEQAVGSYPYADVDFQFTSRTVEEFKTIGATEQEGTGTTDMVLTSSDVGVDA